MSLHVGLRMHGPTVASLICANSLGLLYLFFLPSDQVQYSHTRVCESELRELLDTRSSLAWYRSCCFILFALLLSVGTAIGGIAYLFWSNQVLRSPSGLVSAPGRGKGSKGVLQ